MDSEHLDAPKPKRRRHADGIYLGLPIEHYVEDDALSGSGFYTLLSEPGAFQWERADNPLYNPPETKPQLRGSASHCAILEGLDAYERAYCVPPEGAHVLATGDDCGAWLRETKAAGLHALPISGKKDELMARIAKVREGLGEEHPAYPRFADELVGGRKLITRQDDMFVRLLERFVRGDKALAPLVSDGVPEVSIFLTRPNGVRVKCRPDYLTARHITDLKTYGRAPGRGRSLRRQLVRDGWYNGYDLQAVHNHGLVLEAGERCLDGQLHIAGGDDLAANRLIEIFGAHKAMRPVFHWLYLRMGGAISGIDIPFRESDGQWRYAQTDIAEATDTFIAYFKRCGDGLWLTSEGRQEINDLDWPIDAMENRA